MAVFARVARGGSLAGVLFVSWLLLASTPVAGGSGGSLADDPAAEGAAVVGHATDRLPAPSALARPTLYAALVAAASTLALAGISHVLRPERALIRARLLAGAQLGRAPPPFTS